MAVPMGAPTRMPVMLPFAMTVLARFLRRLGFAIFVMTVPGFIPPFMYHVEFSFAMAAFDFVQIAIGCRLLHDFVKRV